MSFGFHSSSDDLRAVFYLFSTNLISFSQVVREIISALIRNNNENIKHVLLIYNYPLIFFFLGYTL